MIYFDVYKFDSFCEHLPKHTDFSVMWHLHQHGQFLTETVLVEIKRAMFYPMFDKFLKINSSYFKRFWSLNKNF